MVNLNKIPEGYDALVIVLNDTIDFRAKDSEKLHEYLSILNKSELNGFNILKAGIVLQNGLHQAIMIAESADDIVEVLHDNGIHTYTEDFQDTDAMVPIDLATIIDCIETSRRCIKKGLNEEYHHGLLDGLFTILKANDNPLFEAVKAYDDILEKQAIYFSVDFDETHCGQKGFYIKTDDCVKFVQFLRYLKSEKISHDLFCEGVFVYMDNPQAYIVRDLLNKAFQNHKNIYIDVRFR